MAFGLFGLLSAHPLVLSVLFVPPCRRVGQVIKVWRDADGKQLEDVIYVHRGHGHSRRGDVDIDFSLRDKDVVTSGNIRMEFNDGDPSGFDDDKVPCARIHAVGACVHSFIVVA